MPAYIYHASDFGAPLLKDVLGSVVGVLDSCLCTGFNGRPTPGWTIPFFSENDQAVFRTGAGSDSRYFQINDNLVGLENLARIKGYETMSALDVGTGMFPTSIQEPGSAWILKSLVKNSFDKNWIVLANSKICYLIINSDPTNVFENATITVFGDFVSYNASIDLYKTLLIYRNSSTLQSSYDDFFSTSCTITNVLSNHVALRSYTGLGGSCFLGKHHDTNKTDILFPNPVDGSLAMSPIYITEPGVLRGYLPGIWKLCSNRTNFQHGDVFEGSGTLTGKTFEICKIKNTCLALETSNTW